MATERQQRILGYAGVGLFLGIVLFVLFYIVTVRAGVAQRFEWSWVAIFLVVLLGPSIGMGFYGAQRAEKAQAT